jgi:hypothetical protein
MEPEGSVLFYKGPPIPVFSKYHQYCIIYQLYGLVSFLEAENQSARQDIPNFFWNPQFHYSAHKNLTWSSVLTHIPYTSSHPISFRPILIAILLIYARVSICPLPSKLSKCSSSCTCVLHAQPISFSRSEELNSSHATYKYHRLKVRALFLAAPPPKKSACY